MMTTSGIAGIYRTALAEHAKAALVEVVNREPDMTLEELAELVVGNPELGGLTLEELLRGLRERQQPTSRPPITTTDLAARRIAGHEAAVQALVEHGLDAARELGLAILAVRIRARWAADDESPLDGIFIDFRIEAPSATRSRFWDRIHEPLFDLPFEVSLTAS
jgi:hypothetical protein